MKNKRNIFLFSIFLFCITLVYSCYSQNKNEPVITMNKQTIKGSIRLPYTANIYTPPEGGNGQVLYFFHGVGGDAASWESVQSRLEFETGQAPTVISISFGPIWFLTTGGNEDSPVIFMDQFVQNLILDLEEKNGLNVRGRIVCGMSMGAYNAALLASNYPLLFRKAVLISPSIMTVSPYSRPEEIEQHIIKLEDEYLGFKQRIKKFLGGTSSVRASILNMCRSQKQRFPSPELWNENDILQAAQRMKAEYPETYISCGEMDENGFFEGAKMLAEILEAKGTKVVFIPLNGNHSARDYTSFNQFISN